LVVDLIVPDGAVDLAVVERGQQQVERDVDRTAHKGLQGRVSGREAGKVGSFFEVGPRLQRDFLNEEGLEKAKASGRRRVSANNLSWPV
jgi:hypothetical protein